VAPISPPATDCFRSYRGAQMSLNRTSCLIFPFTLYFLLQMVRCDCMSNYRTGWFWGENRLQRNFVSVRFSSVNELSVLRFAIWMNSLSYPERLSFRNPPFFATVYLQWRKPPHVALPLPTYFVSRENDWSRQPSPSPSLAPRRVMLRSMIRD